MTGRITFGIALILMFTAGTLVMNVINEMFGENAAIIFLALVFVGIALAVVGYEGGEDDE